MSRSMLRMITWFLIAILTFGNPVAYAAERDRTTAPVPRTLERLDADGKTLSRLIVKSRSRSGDSVFVLERNGHVAGKGDVRFSKASRSMEVTITAVGTKDTARVRVGAEGSNIGVLIGFGEMEATFSVDIARLRAYADEQRSLAADPERRPGKSSADVDRLRDIVKPTGHVRAIYGQLAKSPLQNVVEEIGSMIVEANEADDTAALFAIRKAVGVLAPKVVLDHFKKTTTPQVVAATLGIPLNTRPHADDYKVAECDWVLFGACWAYFFIGVAGCYDMFSHCLDECWFDPDCSWSYIAKQDNRDACLWLLDGCLAFYGIVLALCVDQACQGCPECQQCVVNC